MYLNFYERRDRMIIIGITGQSGAGKGAVSKILSSYGIQIIDADKVYHNIISPPSRCLDELVSHFGRTILTASGELNRQALGLLVFGKENTERLELLNKISHKHVCAEIRRIISSLKAIGCECAAIDAPLLLEAELERDCDFTISVIADKETRINRIMARDSIDRDAAERRINSQKPIEFYVENTDFTVENNSDVASLRDKITKILITKGVINGNG